MYCPTPLRPLLGAMLAQIAIGVRATCRPQASDREGADEAPILPRCARPARSGSSRPRIRWPGLDRLLASSLPSSRSPRCMAGLDPGYGRPGDPPEGVANLTKCWRARDPRWPGTGLCVIASPLPLPPQLRGCRDSARLGPTSLSDLSALFDAGCGTDQAGLAGATELLLRKRPGLIPGLWAIATRAIS
jgi:hypothetical protein